MIFNLFKSKPTLKELIPEEFVDIHSHILPGIDDGAKDIKESLVLLSEMEKMGFKKIIATPHTYPGLYENNPKKIIKSYDLVNSNLKGSLEIEYATEYFTDSYLIEKAENKQILTINKNYILIELSFNSKPINLYEIVFKLQLNDYIPIIAHPERYIYMFNNNLKDFHKLKKIGCKFQLNLLSTTGYYGKHISQLSDKLLRENFIDFVGSDIHNLRHIKEFESKIKINEVEKLEKAIDSNRIFS